MLATTRDAIAEALSTADGVTGYPVRPTVLKAGAAWPLLASVDRGPGQSYAISWRVLVVLGPDELTAISQVDAFLPVLVDALLGVLFVEQATPVTLATNAGDLFALQITGRSE